MITASHILKFANNVNSEQTNACDRVYDEQKKQYFWLVASRSQVTDDGCIVEYEVRWNGKERGFSCTCPSGQEGWANVQHRSGVCWHVRAAVKAAQQIRDEAEQRRLNAQTVEQKTEVREEVKPTRIVDSVPAWMLNGPVAHHMRKAPRELDMGRARR